MKKKAQGLSMTTIVVAELALLVLVVLALVFTGRMGNFASGVKQTTTCEQACISAGFADDTTTSTENPLTGYKTDDGKSQCYCAAQATT